MFFQATGDKSKTINPFPVEKQVFQLFIVRQVPDKYQSFHFQNWKTTRLPLLQNERINESKTICIAFIGGHQILRVVFQIESFQQNNKRDDDHGLMAEVI